MGIHGFAWILETSKWVYHDGLRRAFSWKLVVNGTH